MLCEAELGDDRSYLLMIWADALNSLGLIHILLPAVRSAASLGKLFLEPDTTNMF